MGRGFLGSLQGFADVDRPAPEPEVFKRFHLSFRTDILTFIMVGCAALEPYSTGLAFLNKDLDHLTHEEASFKQDLHDLADTLNFKESLVQLTSTDLIDIYHYLLDNPWDTDLIAERWAEICSCFNAGNANKSVNDRLIDQEATYEEHQEILVQQHATFIDQRLGRGKAPLYEKCLRSYFKEVCNFHDTCLHEPHPDKCVIHDIHLIKKSKRATPEDIRQAEEDGLRDNEQSAGRSSSRASSVRPEDDERSKGEGRIGNEQIKKGSRSRTSSIRSEDHQQAKELMGNERSIGRSPSRATSVRSNGSSRTESVDTKPSRQTSSSTRKPRSSGLFSDLLRGADEFSSLTRSSSLTTPRPRPIGMRDSRTESKVSLIASPKRGRRPSPDNRSTTGKDTRDPGRSSYREESSIIPEYYLRSLSLKDGQPDVLRDRSRASSDRGATISSDDTLPGREGRGRRQLTPTSDEWERGGQQQHDHRRR